MSHIQLHNAESISRKLGFFQNLDLPLEEAYPTRWGVAKLIRREVRRRGLITRRDLRQSIEPFFLAAGIEEDSGRIIQDVADEMVELRELAELKVENQRGYVTLPSRWLRMSDDVAILLGATATETYEFNFNHPKQFPRRFQPKKEVVRKLEDAGIYEQSFEDWLGKPGWSLYCEPNHHIDSLDALLSFYIESLESEGALFDVSNTSILAIKYDPGAFFGQPWDSGRTRWTSPAELPEGIYLGAQRGFHERQWHPLLLKTSVSSCKSYFINSKTTNHIYDLRNWLLLALAARNGKREMVLTNHDSSCLQITFPLPAQVIRCLKLAGESSSPWQYRKLSDVFPFIDFR